RYVDCAKPACPERGPTVVALSKIFGVGAADGDSAYGQRVRALVRQCNCLGGARGAKILATKCEANGGQTHRRALVEINFGYKHIASTGICRLEGTNSGKVGRARCSRQVSVAGGV